MQERKRRYPSIQKVAKQLDEAEDIAHKIAERKRIAEANKQQKIQRLQKERYLLPKGHYTSYRNTQKIDIASDDDIAEELSTITDSKRGTGAVLADRGSNSKVSPFQLPQASKQQIKRDLPQNKHNSATSNQNPHKQLSLIDRLNKKEKLEEESAILQCLRYIVEHNFFDPNIAHPNVIEGDNHPATE